MLSHGRPMLIAMRCGFDDAAYFTRVFRSFYGCTPSQLREKNG
jgi:AraC-like DNA-binding protein